MVLYNYIHYCEILYTFITDSLALRQQQKRMISEAKEVLYLRQRSEKLSRVGIMFCEIFRCQNWSKNTFSHIENILKTGWMRGWGKGRLP